MLVGCSGCEGDSNRVLMGCSGCERDSNMVLEGCSGCERDSSMVLVGCSGCERVSNMTLVDTVLMMLNHLQIPYRLLGTKLWAPIRITSQQSFLWTRRLVGPAMAAVTDTAPVA